MKCGDRRPRDDAPGPSGGPSPVTCPGVAVGLDLAASEELFEVPVADAHHGVEHLVHLAFAVVGQLAIPAVAAHNVLQRGPIRIEDVGIVIPLTLMVLRALDTPAAILRECIASLSPLGEGGSRGHYVGRQTIFEFSVRDSTKGDSSGGEPIYEMGPNRRMHENLTDFVVSHYWIPPQRN